MSIPITNYDYLALHKYNITNIIMTNSKNTFLVKINLVNKDITYMQMEYTNCNISIDFDNYIRKG